MSRPWSPAEIEQRVPDLTERIETGLTELKRLGVSSAQAEANYRFCKAIAYTVTAANFSGRRSNEQERESAATLHVFTADQIGMRCPEHVGSSVVDVVLVRDLSANAYADARSVLFAVQKELDIVQTLLVSARQVQDSGR